MNRKHYVIIEWPESQAVMQFPREYFDLCREVTATYPTYAVPVKVWDDYLSGKIEIPE